MLGGLSKTRKEMCSNQEAWGLLGGLCRNCFIEKDQAAEFIVYCTHHANTDSSLTGAHYKDQGKQCPEVGEHGKGERTKEPRWEARNTGPALLQPETEG